MSSSRWPVWCFRVLSLHVYSADSLGVPNIVRMLSAPTDITSSQHAGRTYFYQDVSWYSFLCRRPWINARSSAIFPTVLGSYTYCLSLYVAQRLSGFALFYRASGSLPGGKECRVSELSWPSRGPLIVPGLLERLGTDVLQWPVIRGAD